MVRIYVDLYVQHVPNMIMSFTVSFHKYFILNHFCSSCRLDGVVCTLVVCDHSLNYSEAD